MEYNRHGWLVYHAWGKSINPSQHDSKRIIYYVGCAAEVALSHW